MHMFGISLLILGVGAQDLFLEMTPGQGVPLAGPVYAVEVHKCGLTEVFQSWGLMNASGVGALQLTIFRGDEPTPLCLSNQVAVVNCSKDDLTQQWRWGQPSSSGSHHLQSGVGTDCLRLDSTKEGAAPTMGACDDTPAAAWFVDEMGSPANMLRTMAGSRQCLSAVTRSGLPGPPPQPGSSLCGMLSGMLPNATIPFIGPVSAPAGITLTLNNLTLQLPLISLKHFSQCGFYDSEPGAEVSKSGTLTFAIDIPEVPFNVPNWHFERPPAHGSGTANGWAHALIYLTVNYDLVKPRLECVNFSLTLPDLDLHLHGGGGWAPIVKDVTGAIKSVVKSQVPQIGDPMICPMMDQLAPKLHNCAGRETPVELLLCLGTDPVPVCKEPPCYACDKTKGVCGQVPAGTDQSTPVQEDCATACSAPGPAPPPCLPDGKCADASLDHGCCTHRTHRTTACAHGRCGCVPKGTCADYKNDCCSRKGHKTAACGLGISFRCD